MTAINRKWVLGKNVEKGSEAQDQVTESAQVPFNAWTETGKQKQKGR